MSIERIFIPKPGFKREDYKIKDALYEFVGEKGNRVVDLNTDDLSAKNIETQCGLANESQDVEQYDGTLGVARFFVDTHQGPVGQFQWNNNLATIYTNPGNVNGVRWGSGTLIARDLFLTAGHLFDQNPQGWVVPRINNTNNPISTNEIAQNMQVNFNYQRDPDGNLRLQQSFSVIELLEYRLGGLDYAIVRLSGNAGDTFGIAHPSRRDGVVGEIITIIGHPAGLPKQVEVGPLTAINGNQIRYSDTDTLGGSSGSGVLLSPYGRLVGVHTNGGCSGTNPETGFNIGERIMALRNVSPILAGIPRAEVDHFLTTNSIERQQVLNNGGIDEGIACYVFDSPTQGTVPFYRMIGPAGDHFYTTSLIEQQQVVNDGGIDEGIACYVFDSSIQGTIPLYRLINPTLTGNHLFTTSSMERQHVINMGGVDEGVACHVFDSSTQGTTPLYRLRRTP